jgi:adenylate cyclase
VQRWQPVDDTSSDALTLEALAERSGAGVQTIRRLLDLGILQPGEGEQPFTVGDSHRTRLVLACEQAGLPLEGIGQVIRDGKLSLAFLDLPTFRWAARSAKTHRELAEEHGLPVELLLDIHEALGHVRPGPDDPAREDDVDGLRAAQVSLAAGIPEKEILGVLRVYAESLQRMAEAETRVYHEYIERPLLESGIPERALTQAALQFGVVAVQLIDRVITNLYHRAQEHSWIEDLVEHVQDALDEAGIHERLARPPAICFLDLSGYTRLTDERGDEAAAELASNLASIVQGTSRRHAGRPVKFMGDGVMFHFKDPQRGVVSALEMVEVTPRAGLPPAHVGLDAGPVVYQDGDYFGRTVNIASRLSDRAGPGQVLVTESVVEVAAGDAAFREVGPMELKGVSRPVRVFEAMPGSDPRG